MGGIFSSIKIQTKEGKTEEKTSMHPCSFNNNKNDKYNCKLHISLMPKNVWIIINSLLVINNSNG